MNRSCYRTQRVGGSSGQVLVVAAVALAVLGVIAALTMDVGYMFCARARLQNAADAATLAAAFKLAEERNAQSGEETARSAAASEAAALVAANWTEAGSEVAFGTFTGGVFVEQPVSVPATAVRVSAYRNENAPGGALSLFFAPLVGRQTAEVSAAAVSGLDTGIKTVRNCANMTPFAVHEGEVAAPGETMIIYDHDQTQPGNFGLLDLNGGSNPTWEIEDWILHGYDGEVTIDPELGCTWIEGQPGFRAAIEDAVQERIDDTLLVCVYDQVVEQGANTEYRIIRFLAVTLTGCRLHGNNKYIEARVERMVSLPNGETGGPATDNVCLIKLVQ